MEGCSVKHCKNNFRKGGKDFYRFPRTPAIQQQWISFTQRNPSEIDPKDSFICEDHFDKNSLENRMGITCLAKNAVPTIYRSEKNEIRMLPEIVESSAPSSTTESELEKDELIEEEPLQEEEVNPVKNCCRFCGEIKEVNYPIKNLELFGVNVQNFMILMDMHTDFNSLLSDIVCESCFERITPLGTLKDQFKAAEMAMLGQLGFVEEEITEEYLDNNESDLHGTTIIEEHIVEDSSEIVANDNNTTDRKTIIIENLGSANLPPPAKKPRKTIKRSLFFECNICSKIFEDTIIYKNHICMDLNLMPIDMAGKERILKCIERIEEIEEPAHQRTAQKASTSRKKQIIITKTENLQM